MGEPATQDIHDLVRSGEVEISITALESLTRKEPANWRAYNRLGAAYAQDGRLDDSVSAFRRAVKLNARVASLHYNLGQAYELSGSMVDALHEYEVAQRLDPHYELARKAYSSLRDRLNPTV